MIFSDKKSLKRLSRQSRVFVIGLFCILIILLGLSMLPVMNTKSAISSHDLQVSFSLVPHEPIRILCDSDFGSSKYNFPGSGTEKDPYIIAGYGISTTGGPGISISEQRNISLFVTVILIQTILEFLSMM